MLSNTPRQADYRARALEAANLEAGREENARRRGGSSSRVEHPIPDMGVTIPEKMVNTLNAIDASLDRGETVYVHCWGGIGRTGTVVGCWLVRHGSTANEAIELIRERRIGLRVFKRYPDSPQTSAQARFIDAWQPGK